MATAQRANIRKQLAPFALFALLFLGGIQVRTILADPTLWVPVDFMAFWSGGKLQAEGANPYDEHAVRKTQTDHVAGVDEAVIMWNPPWTLAVCLPFGLLPVRMAMGLWFLFHLALVVASADVLWRLYGGHSKYRGLAWLLALTLAPTVYLFAYGQLTAICLAGLAGFLFFHSRQQPVLAGVFGGLTAAKPHLFSLFALGLVLEATRNRDARKTLWGGVLLAVVTAVVVTLPNPDVWSQYWNATWGPSSEIHRSPAAWKPPLVGWYLRQLVPGKPFSVQFVPMVCGCVAFVVVWWKKQSSWDWQREMPWVLGIGLLIAPYGAWAHDGVLLVLPILAAAAFWDKNSPWHRAVLVVYLLVNTIGYATYLLHALGETYIWLHASLLAVCAMVKPNVTPTPKRISVEPQYEHA
jgi:hypothetical protein